MSGTPLQIVVGLGNPGPEHLLTRHNAGFWFVDALAAQHGARFRGHTKFHGDICKLSLKSGDVTLLKPTTYMNRSGLALRAMMDYLKVPASQVLVVHDELDLPAGVARFKQGGGHGGHNGLRDAVTHIGADFWRLRLGIGHPGNKGDVIDYVLHRPSRLDEDEILASIAECLNWLPVFINEGAEKAMNGLHANGKGK
jgi:PTH1 family peptidyl-tRNA hydrolase